MQAEMQRFMRDYPDGNVPEEKIREWEAQAQAARLGDEASDLQAAIAADETRQTQQQKADKPPRDLVEPSGPKSRADAKLIDGIAGLYGTVGMLVFMFDQFDGSLILTESATRARELVAVANHHPAMKKALKRITESNDYIALAVGHGGMALAILQHHNALPKNLASMAGALFKQPGSEHAAQVGG